MQHIARLLDIPGQSGPPSPAYVGAGVYSPRTSGRGSRENRPSFHAGRLAEFTAPRRENLSGVIHRTDPERRRKESPHRPLSARKETNNIKRETPSRDPSGNRIRSREGSPRMPRPKSEEIPLELIKKSPASIIDTTSKVITCPRPQTPRNEIENPVTTNETVQNVISVIASEETSFIAQESTSTPRKKGTIETV